MLDTFRGYIHNHPNYYSRYMWQWPAVHRYFASLGNDTFEGWRRNGWWETTGIPFQMGSCTQLYNRTCGNPLNMRNVLTGAIGPVIDPELAFGSTTSGKVSYTVDTVLATGRWIEDGTECMDYVLKGCFNNGTCVAPDTVRARGSSREVCTLEVVAVRRPVCGRSGVKLRC